MRVLSSDLCGRKGPADDAFNGVVLGVASVSESLAEVVDRSEWCGICRGLVEEVAGGEKGDGMDMLIGFVSEGERRRVGKGETRDMVGWRLVGNNADASRGQRCTSSCSDFKFDGR